MSLLLSAGALAAFQLLLGGIAGYLGLGLIAAITLLACGNRGLGAFDEHALRNAEAKSSIGFRVLIFPGLIALWPFVLWRRWRARSGQSVAHGRPHIDRRHRVSWILLLIALPPLFIAAMLSGRTAGPPPIDPQLALSAAGAETGVPLARVTVDAELPEGGYVERLQFRAIVLRADGDAGIWLHTVHAAERPLPPDTLLYWQPNVSDAEEFALAAAYLLGPLPAGEGRLPMPAAYTSDGMLAGYSLARQELLFAEALQTP